MQSFENTQKSPIGLQNRNRANATLILGFILAKIIYYNFAQDGTAVLLEAEKSSNFFIMWCHLLSKIMPNFLNYHYNGK